MSRPKGTPKTGGRVKSDPTNKTRSFRLSDDLYETVKQFVKDYKKATKGF